MNLKERLVNTKKNSASLNKNVLLFDGNCDVNNFFIDKNEVKNILSQQLASYKNIIFVCDKSIDNSLIANYFYSLSNVFGSTIVDSVENDIENFNNRISIIPNPNINEIVKIFEYILYGYKSFVFGLNFSSNIDILNKLKTVIAINYPNLNNINIETLLGFSNSLFVYFEINDDGLYYISEINKLNYVNEKLTLNSIFLKDDSTTEVRTENDIQDIVVEDVIAQDVDINSGDENLASRISLEQPVEDRLIEDKTEIAVVESNIEDDFHNDENVESNIIIENIEPDNLEKKVNKYKLLKEKIKNKRNI